ALFGYQAGILHNWDSPALMIGGVADHVHSLFLLSKNHALIKIVEEVKKGSSKWLKMQGPEFQDFHWQNGYGAFSVSPSNAEAVKSYIQNQEEHHRKMTFRRSFGRFSNVMASSLMSSTCGIEEICFALTRRWGWMAPRATPWADLLCPFGA